MHSNCNDPEAIDYIHGGIIWKASLILKSTIGTHDNSTGVLEQCPGTVCKKQEMEVEVIEL